MPCIPIEYFDMAPHSVYTLKSCKVYVHAMEVQSGLADFEVSAQTMSVKRCMLLPTLIPTLPGKVFFPHTLSYTARRV